jgi:hypothetical protein
MTRSARLAVAVVAASAAVPATASAQTFAGGGIGPGARSYTGTSELGFRVRDGRITVRGAAQIQCRGGRTSEVEGTASGPLNADGTFRLTFTRRRLQLVTSSRYRRRVLVTGQVRGAEVAGRIEATASGGGVRGCRGTFDFLARSAPALSTDAAPPPGGRTLIGMTSGTRGGPFGLNLRVGPDGRRITHLVTTARNRCRRLRPYQETNYSPPIAIAEDGTFRQVERFKIRFSDVTDSVTITTTGRFVAGGATGTWQARTVSRSRRTRRIVDRCGTGRLTWSASVV